MESNSDAEKRALERERDGHRQQFAEVRTTLSIAGIDHFGLSIADAVKLVVKQRDGLYAACRQVMGHGKVSQNLAIKELGVLAENAMGVAERLSTHFPIEPLQNGNFVVAQDEDDGSFFYSTDGGATYHPIENQDYVAFNDLVEENKRQAELIKDLCGRLGLEGIEPQPCVDRWDRR